MPVLDRYIIRSIGASVVIVMMALLTLLGLFLFVNEQGWVGVGNYGHLQALRYVAFNLPSQLLQFLPVGVLIGSLLAMGGLARHSELTVFRAAGVPIYRIGASVFLAGLLVLPLAFVTDEYLAPPLARMARIHKATLRNGEISLAGPGGAWVRDGGLILRAGRRSSGIGYGIGYGSVSVFEIGPDNRLRAAGRAQVATERPAAGWELRDYAWSTFDERGVRFGSEPVHALASGISPAFFGMIVADPAELSLRELWRTSGYLESNGLDSRRMRFAFWSHLARLVAIPFAALLALPFLFGSLRVVETGARAMLGLGIGLGYFILQRMVESGTIAFGLDPLLLAWLPTALLVAALAALFARLRH
ncbi:MAG TPA: LPS export ABC transporter permease LptG [Steroidobacteraceae bacterium]|nr:LPS export ABC transporter permease LptG [Steroidobacteraceae bacterium]